MENQTPTAEELQQENIAAETIETQHEPTAEQRTYESTADIIIRVKEMAEAPLSASKEELDQLKQTFYKLHRAAVEAARQAHLDNGFAPEDFKVDTTDEDEYKAAMSVIKEARAEQQRKEEQEREENALRKEAILDRLQAMLDSADVEQTSYNDFKALQQEWKTIGEVPAPKVADLWKRYQALTERFYDLLKLSIEFREYDFKKNLEAKTRLCEAAERLAGGGGHTWASTYAEIVRTLNEIGSFATVTDGVIFHNTLASSDYGWLKHGTFVPRPSYFSVLLWKKLMGNTVYDSGEAIRPGAHVFCHDRADGKEGKAYLVINTSWTDTTTVELPGEATVYALTGKTGMRSRTMCLNGKELVLGENDELPELTGVAASGKVEVAPGGCTFIVL